MIYFLTAHCFSLALAILLALAVNHAYPVDAYKR